MRGGKLRAKTTGIIGKIISLAIWDSTGIPKNWECPMPRSDSISPIYLTKNV